MVLNEKSEKKLGDPPDYKLQIYLAKQYVEIPTESRNKVQLTNINPIVC